MLIENPYHEGELFVQRLVGETIQAQQNGRVISDTILKGALRFIEQQPMVVLGSIDGQQNIWASIIFGLPGFMKPLDPHTIHIDLTKVILHLDDPFWKNIQQTSAIGMLVIELGSRRRLRISGTIAQTALQHYHVNVLASYPNCPKYIQRRHLISSLQPCSTQVVSPHSGRSLTPAQQSWIALADTLFVASAHPNSGVDASHRGGNPGFVQVLNEQTLRIPDYAGNSMFNTLGNLAVNSRAGLVFLDFEQSRTLQLIGKAEIQWNLDSFSHPTGGTSRYWDFHIEQWIDMEIPRLLHWEFFDYSPHNPNTKEATMI